MVRSSTLLVLVFVACLASVPNASAQSPVLAELYGRGVHAYYGHNLLDAHRYLTMAIENGSQDPRAFYFRGIVNAATGRQAEAEGDWHQGARLEALGEYDTGVGRALQRVQGSVRMELENVRQMVRLEVRADKTKRMKARYDDLKAAEADVLRGGSGNASAPSQIPVPNIPPAAEIDASSNPFGADADKGQPVPDAKNNPFADDPLDPSAPAGGDVMTPGDTEPDGASDLFPPGVGGDAPAPAAGDPFTSPAPAGDPFTSPAADGAGAAAPADGAAPAGGAAPADPFGDPFGTN